MAEEERVIKRRVKRSTNVWKHNDLYCTIDDWELIQKTAIKAGKTPSAFIIDCTLNYEGVPVKYENNTGVKGDGHPIAYPQDKWEIICEKADAIGFKHSRYVLSCVMATIKK